MQVTPDHKPRMFFKMLVILIRTENVYISVSLSQVPAKDGNNSQKINEVVSLLWTMETPRLSSRLVTDIESNIASTEIFTLKDMNSEGGK